MTQTGPKVLILGSAPCVQDAADWSRGPFTHILAINNAWRVRPDWDFLIHPEDFPVENQPQQLLPTQQIITAQNYVPAQNAYGGFVYAGGTMAFTAGYWALHALQPDVIAYFGCDMVYPARGNTHFYGTGQADPLRQDITLRSLEAKSSRLMQYAARQGCRMVRLSDGESRLVCPSSSVDQMGDVPLMDVSGLAHVEAQERALGYYVPSGRYWKDQARFDVAELDRIDRLWLGDTQPDDVKAA
ncbi:hypothetical protein TRL7639_00764 [Falsiruegeria litorea R37]|uniref:Glycosyltransferase family 29 (Sialyltransferase) n=1 Tax=Falsiruegeria litorea R37 TaxID=1200284 RepID=A0A1Y5RTD2_9RHOB|nr:hypothetical protein [Falsiruegeria litorea]SLN23950.1 hypothetical protein TRL7639_00764 [Falsiruegeria litorea R37]